MARQNSWAEEVEEEIVLEDSEFKEQDKKQWTNGIREPPCWMDGVVVQVRQSKDRTFQPKGRQECDDHPKMRKPDAQQYRRHEHQTEKPACRENSEGKGRKTFNRNAVKNWFGYDYESEMEDSSEEERDKETKWTTVERGENRKEKARRQRRNIISWMEESVQKVQQMVGLGPINRDIYEENMKIEKDYEHAKVNMVRDYLAQVYKYNSEELDNLHIEGTKLTDRDNDIFVYIAVYDIEEIKEIYRRKAKIYSEVATLLSFVPPQLFA